MLKKILKVFLIVFITIVVLIVALGLYIWFKNPLGLRGVIQYKIAPQSVQMDETYDHPLLNVSQEKQLRDIGIDPATLPTEITPAQQACLQEKLGATRAAELLKGAAPTTADALKAATCL
ncbi:hypothetical protein GYA54_00425 [Candidatus Kuenenbacteria bacterium]|nr:hypothetical protein [Candidatus Kuenenbacteria bacterium]